jgi:hypothetical protein
MAIFKFLSERHPLRRVDGFESAIVLFVMVDHVTKELGIPDRRKIGVGNEWSSEFVEEFTRVRIEQRAVGVKGPILDCNRNFVFWRSLA